MNTGVVVKLLGRTCGCIRPSSCLVAGCTLVVGTLIGFRSPFRPRGNVDCRSSRMAGGSLLPLPVQVCSYRSILYFCGALNYFLALVKLGLCLLQVSPSL